MVHKAKTVLQIQQTGIMAIVRVDTIGRGIDIAQACLDGGINILEVSYTNNNAGEVIYKLKEKFGDQLVVGAGTVLDNVTARLAILNGAEFIISPSFDMGVQKIANLYQIPYAPGCTSYTEAVIALESGASFIKAFPISSFYGSDLISTFKVPFPKMPILSSGGANLENLHKWVEAGTNCIGIGSLLTKGSISQITENAKKLKNILDETRKKLSDSTH